MNLLLMAIAINGVMQKTIHNYDFYPVGPAEESSHYKNYGRKPLVEKLPPMVPS